MRSGQLATLITCIALLGGCGGGGGDDSGGSAAAQVPGQPTHTLANDESEASALASAAMGSATKTADTSASQRRLSSLSALSGTRAPAGVDRSIKHTLSAATLSKSLVGKETVVLDCADLAGAGVATQCSGTATIDSNIDENSVDNQGNIRAGSYLEMRFNQFAYSSSTEGAVALNGRIRITFETGYSVSPPAGSILYEAIDLSGTSGGQSFGPESATYRLSLADGIATVETNDARISGLQITATDDDSFVISEGTVINGYRSGYLEVSYDEWRVVDGVPQPGSRVSIRGTNGSASVVVSSLDGDVVTFQVTITVDGSSREYQILADMGTGQTIVL